jgi:hypothetical protein
MGRITKEDLNIISQSFDKQVKKAVDKILEANRHAEEGQRDYFKETERLLYAYNDLKLKIEQDREDFQNGISSCGKSKDIVRFSTHSGSRPPEDSVQEELERSRRASMERTRLQVQRIDRALETIGDDQYFDIIPMKYFDKIGLEAIAEALNCDVTTARRNKNRLVNRLKIILFGADALT